MSGATIKLVVHCNDGGYDVEPYNARDHDKWLAYRGYESWHLIERPAGWWDRYQAARDAFGEFEAELIEETDELARARRAAR